MDFTFSVEQDALRESVRSFLAREAPGEYIRTMADDERGFTDDVWDNLAELGWPGLLVPEADGGLGLGLVDMAVVMEEMGRLPFPGPFFSSSVFATLAARRLGDADLLAQLASGAIRGTVALEELGHGDPVDRVHTRARRKDADWILTGQKPLVLDGHTADWAIVVARTEEGLGSFLLEPPRCLQRRETDGFRVDVGVGGALPDGLERRDGPVELLACLRVLGRHLERLLAHAGRDRAHRGSGALHDPLDDRGTRIGISEHVAPGDLHAVELETRLGDAGRRVLAFACHAVRARVHDQHHDGTVVTGRRRHQHPVGDQPGGNARLDTVDAPAVAVGASGRRRVERVGPGLDQRRGQHRLTGDDAWQVLLHLRVGAELRDGQRAEHHGRQHRDRRDGAADLFEETAQGHEPEAAPACVLRQRDPEQARLRQLRPRVAIESLAAGLELLEVLVRLAVGQDLAGEVARRLLLLAQ